MATLEETKKTVMESADPRLAFLWGTSGIPMESQSKFVTAGYTTMANFKNLAT